MNNNLTQYPHDSLERAQSLAPTINITNTSEFTLSRLKSFILPIYESSEDLIRALRGAALPYSDTQLTVEDTTTQPFAVKNFKEAIEPKLNLINLDALGLDGLVEQDIKIIADNMLKSAKSKAPISILLTANTLKNLDLKIEALILALLFNQEFKDERFKSTIDSKFSFKGINIICTQDISYAEQSKLQTIASHIKETFIGILYTRLLSNLPANIADPAYFVEEARILSQKMPGLKLNVYDKEFLKQNNMNAFLAVNSGSNRAPYMTVFEYMPTGTEEQTPVAIIGKGLTFDSGGLSLKPGTLMDEMMFDKCGATSVFGIMYITIMNHINLHLIGVASFTENMPDGNSYRPGDIVTTNSGKTVEVVNTDAEGRLVLCDTISYVVKHYQPKVVIDIATLTGACIVALGHETSGFFANGLAEKMGLVEIVKTASIQSGDCAWQLPLGKLFSQMIEARFGDIVNSSGREAGSITAAEFLKCFAQNTPWMHFDVAGTAWVSGSKKTATGRPVALISSIIKALS